MITSEEIHQLSLGLVKTLAKPLETHDIDALKHQLVKASKVLHGQMESPKMNQFLDPGTPKNIESLISLYAKLSLIAFKDGKPEEARNLANKVILAMENMSFPSEETKLDHLEIYARVILALYYLEKGYVKKSHSILHQIDTKKIGKPERLECFENACFFAAIAVTSFALNDFSGAVKKCERLSFIILDFLQCDPRLPIESIPKHIQSIKNKKSASLLFQAKFYLCLSDMIRSRCHLLMIQKKDAIHFYNRASLLSEALLPPSSEIKIMLKTSEGLFRRPRSRLSSDKKNNNLDLSPSSGKNSFRIAPGPKRALSPESDTQKSLLRQSHSTDMERNSPTEKHLNTIEEKTGFLTIPSNDLINQKDISTPQVKEELHFQGKLFRKYSPKSSALNYGSFDNRYSYNNLDIFCSFRERPEPPQKRLLTTGNCNSGYLFNGPMKDQEARNPEQRLQSGNGTNQKGEMKPKGSYFGSFKEHGRASFPSMSFLKSTTNESCEKKVKDLRASTASLGPGVFNPKSSFRIEPKNTIQGVGKKGHAKSASLFQNSVFIFDNFENKKGRKKHKNSEIGNVAEIKENNFGEDPALIPENIDSNGNDIFESPKVKLTIGDFAERTVSPKMKKKSFLHGRTSKELMNTRNSNQLLGKPKPKKEEMVVKEYSLESEEETPVGLIQFETLEVNHAVEEQPLRETFLTPPPLQMNDLSPVGSSFEGKANNFNADVFPEIPIENTVNLTYNNSQMAAINLALEEDSSQQATNKSMVSSRLNDSIMRTDRVNTSIQKIKQIYLKNESTGSLGKLRKSVGRVMILKKNNGANPPLGLTNTSNNTSKINNVSIISRKFPSTTKAQNAKKSIFSDAGRNQKKSLTLHKNQSFIKDLAVKSESKKPGRAILEQRNRVQSVDRKDSSSRRVKRNDGGHTPVRSKKWDLKEITTFSDGVRKFANENDFDPDSDFLKCDDYDPKLSPQGYLNGKNNKKERIRSRKASKKMSQELITFKKHEKQEKSARMIQKFARWIVHGRHKGEPFPFVNYLKKFLKECKTAINTKSLMKLQVVPFSLFVKFKFLPQFARVSLPPLLESFMTKKLQMKIDLSSGPIYCVIPLKGLKFEDMMADFANSETIWPFLAHVLGVLFNVCLLNPKHGALGYEFSKIESYKPRDKTLFQQSLQIFHSLFNEKFIYIKKIHGFRFVKAKVSNRTFLNSIKHTIEKKRKHLNSKIWKHSHSLFYDFPLFSVILKRPGAFEEYWNWLKVETQDEGKFKRISNRRTILRQSVVSLSKVDRFRTMRRFKKCVKLVILGIKLSKIKKHKDLTQNLTPLFSFREALAIYPRITLSAFTILLEWSHREVLNEIFSEENLGVPVSYETFEDMAMRESKKINFTMVHLVIGPKKPSAMMMTVPLESLLTSDMYFEFFLEIIPFENGSLNLKLKVTKTFPLSLIGFGSKKDIKSAASILAGQGTNQKWQMKLQKKIETYCRRSISSFTKRSLRSFQVLPHQLKESFIEDLKDGIKIYSEDTLTPYGDHQSTAQPEDSFLKPKDDLTPFIRKIKRRDFIYYLNREFYWQRKLKRSFCLVLEGRTAFTKIVMSPSTYSFQVFLYFGDTNTRLIYNSSHIYEWEQACGWASPENQNNLIEILSSQFILETTIIGKVLKLKGLLGRKNPKGFSDSSQAGVYFSIQTGKFNHYLNEKFKKTLYTIVSSIPNLGMSYVRVTIYDSRFSPRVKNRQLLLFEVLPSNSKTKLFKICLNSADIKDILGKGSIESVMDDRRKLIKFLSDLIILLSYQKSPVGGRLTISSTLVGESYRFRLNTKYFLQNEVINQGLFCGNEKNSRKWQKKRGCYKSMRFMNSCTKNSDEQVPYLHPKVHDSPIVVQVMKKIQGKFCMITLERNNKLNLWVFRLYFPQTCRKFVCYLYLNDLIGMERPFLESILTIPTFYDQNTEILESQKSYHDFCTYVNKKITQSKKATTSYPNIFVQKPEEPPKAEGFDFLQGFNNLKSYLRLFGQDQFRTLIVRRQTKSSFISLKSQKDFQEIFLWERLISNVGMVPCETSGNWLLSLNNFRGVIREVLFHSTVICDYGKVVDVEVMLEENRRKITPLEPLPVIYQQFLKYFSVFLRVNVLENSVAANDRVNLQDMVTMAKKDGVSLGYCPSQGDQKVNERASYSLRDLRLIGEYATLKIQSRLFCPVKPSYLTKRPLESPLIKRKNKPSLVKQKSIIEIFPNRVSSELKLNSQLRFDTLMRQQSDNGQIIYREVFGFAPMRVAIIVYGRASRNFNFFVYNADESSLHQKEFSLQEICSTVPLTLLFLAKGNYQELGFRIYKALKNSMVISVFLMKSEKEKKRKSEAENWGKAAEI